MGLYCEGGVWYIEDGHISYFSIWDVHLLESDLVLVIWLTNRLGVEVMF